MQLNAARPTLAPAAKAALTAHVSHRVRKHLFRGETFMKNLGLIFILSLIGSNNLAQAWDPPEVCREAAEKKAQACKGISSPVLVRTFPEGMPAYPYGFYHYEYQVRRGRGTKTCSFPIKHTQGWPCDTFNGSINAGFGEHCGCGDFSSPGGGSARIDRNEYGANESDAKVMAYARRYGQERCWIIYGRAACYWGGRPNFR